MSRIQALLQAEPDEFARAVEEIERSSQAAIERLQRSYERVAHLGSGDHLALPAEVVGYVALLHALGPSDRAAERAY